MSYTNNTSSKGSSAIMTALYRNWAFSAGAVTLPVVFAMFVPKLLIPLICFIEAYFLIALMKSDVASGLSSCSLIVRLTSRVLLITAAIMFVIAVLCTDFIVPTVIYLDLYNSEIPFITCLVIFPVTAIMCALTLFAGWGQRYSRQCQRRNGFYAGDSMVATLYYKETKYQTAILMVITLTLGAVEYWYYFTRYINTDMANPDRFFFNIMPLAIYLLSLLFMAGRYASMSTLWATLESNGAASTDNTLVRFLIFCNDDLLLHCGTDGRWDTPAECIIGRASDVGEQRARLLLMEQTGLLNFDLRYCYTNAGFGQGSNIVHYAAFIAPEDATAFDSGDQWFNAYMLDHALSGNALSPIMANELYRIHTMTMAWKTYNRDGRRLYPIKNYRPTFRFSDMKHWTVDYDDPIWFDIAHNNEDRRFFHFRRFWNGITSAFRLRKDAAE